MNKQKLKTLTIAELETRRQKVLSELHETRFDLRIGQEKDSSIINKKRKELARINTFLNGYELGIYKPSEKSKKTETKEKKTEKEVKEKVEEKLKEKTDKKEVEEKKK